MLIARCQTIEKEIRWSVENGNTKRLQPERESKHAAVTGQPSKFNRESFSRPETQQRSPASTERSLNYQVKHI